MCSAIYTTTEVADEHIRRVMDRLCVDRLFIDEDASTDLFLRPEWQQLRSGQHKTLVLCLDKPFQFSGIKEFLAACRAWLGTGRDYELVLMRGSKEVRLSAGNRGAFTVSSVLFVNELKFYVAFAYWKRRGFNDEFARELAWCCVEWRRRECA